MLRSSTVPLPLLLLLFVQRPMHSAGVASSARPYAAPVSCGAVHSASAASLPLTRSNHVIPLSSAFVVETSTPSALTRLIVCIVRSSPPPLLLSCVWRNDTATIGASFPFFTFALVSFARPVAW